jgi:hypothetical protein
MAEPRSPRYPRISIAQALDFTVKLYDEVGLSQIDTDTAYRLLGFAGKSGSSATILGAMRQYRLLDGLRGTVQISDIALEILEPSSPEREIAAFKKAAINPEIYEKILANFGVSLPKSDEPIRAFLVRSLEFSPVGASECIRSLRQTMHDIAAFRQKDQESEAAHHPISLISLENKSLSEEAPLKPDILFSHSNGNQVRFALSRECSVDIRFDGPISGRALARLMQHLEIMMDTLEEAD